MKNTGVLIGALIIAACVTAWLVKGSSRTDAPAPSHHVEQGIQVTDQTDSIPPTAENRSVETKLIESFNEVEYADKDRGHPDYGSWSHMQALRDRMRDLCLSFAPDEEAWVAKQSVWTVKDENYEVVPVAFFSGGQVVDEAIMSSIRQVDEDYRQVIKDQAVYAYWQLKQSAQDHAQNMKRFPRDGEYPSRDVSKRGLYSAFTVLPAGDWNYVIDFRSIDYPELEDALNRIAVLAEEREAAVRVLLE